MKKFQRRALLGKVGVVAALIATTAVMATGPASATTMATLYVAGSGTATAGCTDSTGPCKTIQEGVTAAEALNDTSVIVAVAAGTYNENVTIDVQSGDTLTLAGLGAGLTIANGGKSGTVFTINSGVVTIDGFGIVNGNANQGGGVFNDGTATLTNDTLSGDASSDLGGGVFNEGTATLTNDTLTGDSADSSGGGGGVYNEGTATLTYDTLSDDSAPEGGGVFNEGTATLTNDTLSGDSATYGAGVYNDATATLTNDTLSGDSAGYGGGGVLNNNIATLTNDTLSGDSAQDFGGGVDNTGGTVTLTYDTLSDDSAQDNGGGVINGGTATLTNSILDAASCYGSIDDGGYNVESDDSCAVGSSDKVDNNSIDLAASLAANGSSGPESLAIGANSSAFEEVPAASCTTITTDERAEPRPGQLGQGACDAGAYEYQNAAPIRHPSQSIGFGALTAVPVTAAPFDLSATTTSGLPVTFTSTTPSVCAVNGATVSVLAIGTCSITASQAGDAVFTAAPSVIESFSVTAAPVALPGAPVIKAMSPFKGRLRITLISPATGATSYQYSLDGRAWVKLAGTGPFTLSGLAHVTVSVRLRGVNVTGSGRASNAGRVRVQS